MLQSMRDKMQGLIAGTIAVVISLTFALWGIQNYLHTGQANQVVAKVNGKKITQDKVNIAYEQKKRSEMLRQGADFSFDQKSQELLKKNILQQLIQEEIISQAIAKFGLGIGQKQLWVVANGSPIFQDNGHFSAERFRQITERIFYSEHAYFEGLKRSILQYQFVAGIIGSAFILPNEIDTAKNLFKQQRDFSYFVIVPEQFAKVTQIADAKVREYYEQHQSDFLVPEKISIQYLKLSSNELHPKTQTSVRQLEQFYHSHIATFSTPKKWQVVKVTLILPQEASAKTADNARKKLEEVVKSKGDLTKVSGAQVSTVWLTRNEAGPSFAAQLDKLGVGQISEPLRTKNGYSIGKVLAIQSEKVEPYAAVVVKVRQMYEHQQLIQVFSEASDKLVDLTYTNSDSLEPAAKELGLKIQVTELVTKTGSKKSGILANNKIIKAAFSDTVLKQGYNSNLIEIDSASVVVLRIKDHIPEKVQPLDLVRSIITQKLKYQEMQKKAHDISQEFLAQLRKGKVTEAMKQYDFPRHVITGASRGQSGVDAKLIEAAFNLAQPTVNEPSITVVDLNGSYAVLQLLKVDEGQTHNEITKEKDILTALPEQFGRFDYQLLVDNLMKKAKVKIT